MNVQENPSESRLLLHELTIAIDNTIKKLPHENTGDLPVKPVLEKRSVKEIAQYMNLSEKAVEYHVTQSLKFHAVAFERFHYRRIIPVEPLLIADT